MKRVIFVNRFFWPDHSATSQICSDLAFSLAEDPETFDVHVVTSRQLYDNPTARLAGQEARGNVTIHRLWTSRFGRQSLIGRASDYLSFYVSAFVRLMVLAPRGSVIVTKTDPPLISVVGALVAKTKGAMLVNWIHDLFPEIAEVLRVPFARVAPVSWSLRALRNFSLHAARANVVIGEGMRQRLLAEGMDESRVRIIPNWADGEQIRPVPHDSNPLRRDWALEDVFVVGYSGNFGRGHDFATILDAATALNERWYIKFLLIGGGANLEWVRQEVQHRGLKNVVIKPYQPRNLLSQSLSVADVHLVTLKPELEGLIVPSKFYGVAAAGRPVVFIGSESGEIARTVVEAGCGYTVAQGNAAALARRIAGLAADRKRCDTLGRNARICLESYYDRVPVFHRWQALLMASK